MILPTSFPTLHRSAISSALVRDPVCTRTIFSVHVCKNLAHGRFSLHTVCKILAHGRFSCTRRAKNLHMDAFSFIFRVICQFRQGRKLTSQACHAASLFMFANMKRLCLWRQLVRGKPLRPTHLSSDYISDIIEK